MSKTLFMKQAKLFTFTFNENSQATRLARLLLGLLHSVPWEKGFVRDGPLVFEGGEWRGVWENNKKKKKKSSTALSLRKKFVQ